MPAAKQLLLFLLTILSSLYTNSQNVGIGTTTPLTKLEVLTGDGWGIIHTNGSVRVGTYAGSGGGWIATQTTHPLYFATSLLNANSSAQMTLLTNGNLGIGTLVPFSKLDVLTADASYGITHTNGTVRLGTYIGSNGGWIGTQSNHPLYFFTNNGNAAMSLSTTGNFGIGTTTPVNTLQIGSVGSTGFSGNAFTIGNGGAMAFNQNVVITNWTSSTNISILPRLGNGSGSVSIMGDANVSGSGSYAGNLVIGSSSPSSNAPLDVETGYQLGTNEYAYVQLTGYSHNQFGGSAGQIAPYASIWAAGNVVAQEFDAQSDARIKDIADMSNSAKDLETLNAIQITNYTMKDKVKNGNRSFKKVIAQQVEEVYPQLVSKGVNYIPNVYQLTSKVEKSGNAYLLSFKTAHNLDKDAKKIQLIEINGAQQRYDIVAIPSDKEVLINAPDLSDTVFVYGEQVNDFRTVDYDGLTTLNISATQELSKIVKQQSDEINELKKKIEELEQQIRK